MCALTDYKALSSFAWNYSNCITMWSSSHRCHITTYYDVKYFHKCITIAPLKPFSPLLLDSCRFAEIIPAFVKEDWNLTIDIRKKTIAVFFCHNTLPSTLLSRSCLPAQKKTTFSTTTTPAIDYM